MVIIEDWCKVVEENEVVKGRKKNSNLRFFIYGSKLNKLINYNDFERRKKKLKLNIRFESFSVFMRSFDFIWWIIG